MLCREHTENVSESEQETMRRNRLNVCSDCYSWDRDRGECRRSPATIDGWPVVKADDWCNQFIPEKRVSAPDFMTDEEAAERGIACKNCRWSERVECPFLGDGHTLDDYCEAFTRKIDAIDDSAFRVGKYTVEERSGWICFKNPFGQESIVRVEAILAVVDVEKDKALLYLRNCNKVLEAGESGLNVRERMFGLKDKDGSFESFEFKRNRA